jgi:hypothetical protein
VQRAGDQSMTRGRSCSSRFASCRSATCRGRDEPEPQATGGRRYSPRLGVRVC